MTPNRERIWVGLFVVIAVSVLAATTVAVWGGMGRSGVLHHVYLKFSGGVEPGTPVRYGGMRIGSVQHVGIDPSDSTQIEVDLVVDRGTPIKTDSVAKLSSLGLLSDYYIEISTGTQQASLAPPDSVLRSTETAGLAQLGDTVDGLMPQIRAALDQLTLSLDTLQTTVSRANDLLNDGNRANIGQALVRVNDLMSDRNRSNLSDSLDNLNQMLSDTRPKLSTGLTNLNDATSRLAPLFEDIRQTSARADQTLANLDSAVTENRPDLRVSVSELREVLASSKAAIDQIQRVMNQNTLNIYETLEDMRASAANIRTLTETIKNRPASLIRGVNVKDRQPGGLQK